MSCHQSYLHDCHWITAWTWKLILDGGKCIGCNRGRRDGVTADIRVHCCRQRASAASASRLLGADYYWRCFTSSSGTSWHSMIQTKHISLNTLLVRQIIDWTVQWSMHQLNPQTVHRYCECAVSMTPCIAKIDAVCIQWHDMLHINEWWCSTFMQHPCSIHATYMANGAQWVMTCCIQKSKLITSSALLHMWEKDDSIYHHQPCHIHGQSTTSFSFNMCLPIIIIVDEWIMRSPNTFPRSSMQHQCYIHATSNESMLNTWLSMLHPCHIQ